MKEDERCLSYAKPKYYHRCDLKYGHDGDHAAVTDDTESMKRTIYWGKDGEIHSWEVFFGRGSDVPRSFKYHVPLEEE